MSERKASQGKFSWAKANVLQASANVLQVNTKFIWGTQYFFKKKSFAIESKASGKKQNKKQSRKL